LIPPHLFKIKGNQYSFINLTKLGNFLNVEDFYQNMRAKSLGMIVALSIGASIISNPSDASSVEKELEWLTEPNISNSYVGLGDEDTVDGKLIGGTRYTASCHNFGKIDQEIVYVVRATKTGTKYAILSSGKTNNNQNSKVDTIEVGVNELVPHTILDRESDYKLNKESFDTADELLVESRERFKSSAWELGTMHKSLRCVRQISYDKSI